MNREEEIAAMEEAGRREEAKNRRIRNLTPKSEWPSNQARPDFSNYVGVLMCVSAVIAAAATFGILMGVKTTHALLLSALIPIGTLVVLYFTHTKFTTILRRYFERDAERLTELDLAEVKDPEDVQIPTSDPKIREWEEFYRDVFGITKDFSNLRIPKKKKGFDRLIIVAKGMTPNKIFNKIKELMPTWKHWDNLDSIISDRKATKDYAIWVRDRIEVDEELKNKSANDLKEEGIQGITLEERLLYELKYFKETGKNLDIDNYTLCAGSRDPYGDVPRVRWDPYYGEVGVSWWAPGARRGGYIRPREVVF